MVLSRVEEASAMRAFMQGALVAKASEMADQMTSDKVLNGPVAVHQGVDNEGGYLNYFEVELASGIVIRVTVEVSEQTVGVLADGNIGIVAP